MDHSRLISDEYRKLNEELHRSPVQYGQRGGRHLLSVIEIASRENCRTILDYGCGKGRLAKAANEHGIGVTNYDPAIPEFSRLPDVHDLTVCTDVMEHIEPSKVDAVITHIAEVTAKVLYCLIVTRKDRSKSLPDGSNPHRSVHAPDWWIERFSHHFDIVSTLTVPHSHFVFTGTRKRA